MNVSRIGARLGDLVNPIVIKELRQAVRGRFVVTLVVLSLLAETIAVIVAMLGQRLESTSIERTPVGAPLFMSIYSVLLFGSIILIPFYAGLRMMAERSDSNVDLFFITAIRPRNVVLGKALSAAAMTALIFSASIPFLVFSYVLRGINFISILLVASFGFVLVVSQSILALFIGALPASKPFKILLGLSLFVVSMGGSIAVTETASRFVRIGTMSSYSPWRELLSLFVTMIVVDVVLIFLTTALVAPASANRALPLRVMFTVLWAATLGLMAWLIVAHSPSDIILLWSVFWLAIQSLVLFSAIGEREEWGPRVARTIPASLPKRLLAFVFYSGGGGTIWALLMMAATLIIFAVFGPANSRSVDGSNAIIWLCEGAACIVGYAGSALWLRRTVLARKIAPRYTWAVVLGLFILLAILPPLAGLAADEDGTSFGMLIQLTTLANPFPITSPPRIWVVRSLILAGWAAVVMAAHVPWAHALFSRFRRLPVGGQAPSPVGVGQAPPAVHEATGEGRTGEGACPTWVVNE